MLRLTQTENGKVKGIPAADPRITAFKGIPFAAPPVGNLRWKAPQPASNWTGTRNCFEFAPIAMQSQPGLNPADIYDREWHVDSEVPLNEDCLYLNIWTPAACNDIESAQKLKLPVYVWYFGGGLQVGYPSEMEFDGERLARRGIVVVTINYRLNAFGFLCHPEITKENPAAPTNFGHLDQQFATQWVKRNIANFGGDGDNITIGGQSAGGGSVIAQLASPQNKDVKTSSGLFQQAIIQSGIFAPAYPNTFGPERGLHLAEVEKRGEEFFAFCKVKSLAEARKIPAKRLMKKVEDFAQSKGQWMMWGTVIDGKFLLDNPYTVLCDGKGLHVPIMLGNTIDEFFAEPASKTIDELKETAATMFGNKADAFISLLEEAGGTSFANALHALKNAARVNGIEYAARLLAKKYADNKVASPLYYYQFGPEIPGWDKPGCFHSVDLWFFFETLAKSWRPWKGSHYELARDMCNYWAEFVKKGNPNGLGMPQWKAFTNDVPETMFFGDVADCGVREPGAVMKYLIDNKK
ncbi:MAG: carboxylesterase family protein [Spirochaetaceae bacterium]|jgi:para-nitrobenzyl esterase|nr:carboxylesterase family protein [Spirochaetaceae bacterium]